MAKYREKPIEPEIVEAIEWTGGNLDEIKAFLGDCFEEIDASGKIWYRNNIHSAYLDWIPSSGYMIIEKNGDFFDEEKENFFEDWEEVTEDGTC